MAPTEGAVGLVVAAILAILVTGFIDWRNGRAEFCQYGRENDVALSDC